MATTPRPRAVAKMNRKNTASVRGKASDMAAGFAGSPAVFVSPNPLPSVLLAQITVVDKLEVVAATRVKGSATTRNIQRSVLASLVDSGVAYVQVVADTAGTADEATSVILAARLTVALAPARTKAILAAKQGPVAGTVLLEANAKALVGKPTKKTCFNWGFTSDGGKTWFLGAPTPTGKTSIPNLTPLTVYGFRVAVTTSDGVMGPWSPVVSFVVH